MAGGTYDNTNRGVLFKNDRKSRDNQPDYTGKVQLGKDVIDAAQRGDEIFVSGWIKEIKTGKRAGEKMLSLAVQPPRDQSGNQQQQQSPRDRARENARNVQNPISEEQAFKEDDIPF